MSEASKKAESPAAKTGDLPNLILLVDERDVPVTSRVPGLRKTTDLMVQEGAKKSDKQPDEELSPWVRDLMGFIEANGGLGSIATSVLLSYVPGGAMVKNLASIASGSGAAAKNDKLKAAEGRALQKYYDAHAVSVAWVASSGLKFAPGHPRMDCSYRLHPLATVPGSGYERHYIPMDSFDQVLLEEREAELLRLLIDLGATRILISERGASDVTANKTFGASATAGDAGDAEISASFKRASSNSDLHTREFILEGRAVEHVELTEADYVWLPFEPNWKALVKARKTGRCTRASVELKTDASYSSSQGGFLKVALPVGSGGAGGEASVQQASTTSYVFQVEFGALSPKEA